MHLSVLLLLEWNQANVVLWVLLACTRFLLLSRVTVQLLKASASEPSPLCLATQAITCLSLINQVQLCSLFLQPSPLRQGALLSLRESERSR